MSTTVLDVAESTRAMFLRHVFVHLRDSTPTDGVMREGHGEYWIEENGAIDPDSGVFNTLNCSWALENGKTVHGSYVDRAGNRGAWEEHAVVCAAGDASDYDYEQYVTNAGDNGNAGTSLGSPVQTVAQAITNMLANLATDEYGVIWVEGNETHTGGTLSIGNNKRTIHIRRRPGSSATTPAITGFSWNPGRSGGLLIDDVNITGSGSGDLFALSRSGAGTRYSWDLIVRGSTITEYNRVLFASDDQWDPSNRTTLNCDFVAFEDCVFDDQHQYHFYASNALERWLMRNVQILGNNSFVNPCRTYRVGDAYWENFTLDTGDNGSIRWIGGQTGDPDDECRYITLNGGLVNGVSLTSIVFQPDVGTSENVAAFKDIRVVGVRFLNSRVWIQSQTAPSNACADVDGFDVWYCHGTQGVELGCNSALTATIRNVWIRDCTWVDRSYGGGTRLLTLGGAKANFPDGAIKMTGCAGLWATDANPEPRYAISGGNAFTEAELRAVFALERNNHIGKNDADAMNYVRASANISLATWQGGSPAHGQGSSVTSTTTFDLTNNGVADVTALDVHLSTTGGPLDGTGFTYGYAVDADGHLRHASAPDAGPFEQGASATPDEPTMGGGGDPPELSVTLEFSVQNDAAIERTETLRCAIPFPEGEVEEADLANLVVDGKATAWLPLQYWPDDSIKVALAIFTDTIAAESRNDYEIVTGTALSSSFARHAWVEELIGSLELGSEVRDTFDSQYRAIVSGSGDVLQDTPLMRVTRWRMYHEAVDEANPGIGRDYLTSTIYLTEHKDMPVVLVDWILGNDYLGADDPESSPDPNLYPLGAVDVNDAHFLVKGATVVTPYRASKEGIGSPEAMDAGRTGYRVMEDTFIGDGQTRRYRFIIGLTPGSADPGEAAAWAATQAAMASDPMFPLASQVAWEQTRAAGLVGGPITGGEDAATVAANELATWEGAAHFGTWETHGDLKDTAAGGTMINQPLTPPFAHAIQGDYHRQLLQLEQMAWTQAVRPSHLFGLELDEETTATLWNGMPFRVDLLTGETLGRRALHFSDPYSAYRTRVTGDAQPHGWKGYDPEHYTQDLLFDYWTATGDAWAHEELRQRGQSMKAAMRLVGGFSSGVFSVRAEGWCLQGLVQSHQATQDEALKTYGMRRVNEIVDVQRKVTHGSQALGFEANHPATGFPNPHEYFMPWQHAAVLYGYLGAYLAWGEPILLTIAESVVATIGYSWVTDVVDHPVWGNVPVGLRYYVPATYGGNNVPADYFDHLEAGIRFGDSPIGGAHGFLMAGLFHLAVHTADASIAAQAIYYGEVLRGSIETMNRAYKWNYCLPYVSEGGGGGDPGTSVHVVPGAARVEITMARPTVTASGPVIPPTPPKKRPRLSLRLGLGL